MPAPKGTYRLYDDITTDELKLIGQTFAYEEPFSRHVNRWLTSNGFTSDPDKSDSANRRAFNQIVERAWEHAS